MINIRIQVNPNDPADRRQGQRHLGPIQSRVSRRLHAKEIPAHRLERGTAEVNSAAVRQGYNYYRPHGAFGKLTPSESVRRGQIATSDVAQLQP